MAKTMFIKRERCLLLPYDKVDALLTEAFKKNRHASTKALEKIGLAWVNRIREYKTLPNVPITQKEFLEVQAAIKEPLPF